MTHSWSTRKVRPENELHHRFIRKAKRHPSYWFWYYKTKWEGRRK
jgi:hypothetical protein